MAKLRDEQWEAFKGQDGVQVVGSCADWDDERVSVHRFIHNCWLDDPAAIERFLAEAVRDLYRWAEECNVAA